MNNVFIVEGGLELREQGYNYPIWLLNNMDLSGIIRDHFNAVTWSRLYWLNGRSLPRTLAGNDVPFGRVRITIEQLSEPELK